MIISFSLENWMSFRDPVTFSMVATRERQHAGRVPGLKKYSAKVLPIAAIYGGNASGKTNFFKALSFAQQLVVMGTRPGGLIPVQPFLLDDRCAGQPSRFCFGLLVDKTLYEFSFAATCKMVLEEKLVRIGSASEKVLYHRRDGKPNFHRSLAGKEFLRFAFRGTRDNQLFLTNSVSQNIDEFRPVHDWFEHQLRMVAPDDRFGAFGPLLDERFLLQSTMNELLPQFDTGIERLSDQEVSFEDLPLPGELKRRIREDVREGTLLQLDGPNNEQLVITRKGGEIRARKLVTWHPKTDGTEVRFEMNQESDGSRRVINLLPAFLELSEQDSTSVYVIDELDRSLHTMLTRDLLDAYLNSCSTESRAQLLLTIHDVQLMDQQLLRRDEMWLTKRGADEASSLYSFCEFKDARYDKDVRKSYLLGRLGGVPQLMLGGYFK